MTDCDEHQWLRDAFDSDDVVAKNLALRRAYDEIKRLSQPSEKVILEHEPCPKCKSTNVDAYWWHTGQAWIIICYDCKHEEGREDSEHAAWRIWDSVARDKITD